MKYVGPQSAETWYEFSNLFHPPDYPRDQKAMVVILQPKHRRNWMGDVEPMPETGSTMEMSILRTTILLRFVFACLTLPFLMEVSEVEAGDGRVPRE